MEREPRVVRWWTLAAAALILLTSIGLSRGRDNPGELPVYVLGSERMIAGEEIYQHGDNRPFTYPPFCALWFGPLALLPEQILRPLWYGINLSALVFILVRLGARLRPMLAGAGTPPRPRTGWLIAIVGILSVRHLLSPIQYQSHDVVVFLLVWFAVEAWCDDRPPRTGIWAGLAAAVKATPLLFLPLLVWHRRWSGAVLMLLTILAASLLPDALLPREDGRLWIAAWVGEFASTARVGSPAEASGAWESWNHLNQSLSGTLYRLFTEITPANRDQVNVSLWNMDRGLLAVLTAAAQMAVLALGALVTWPGRSRGLSRENRAAYRLGEASVVLLAMLLLSPMSSKYHFVTIVVPVAFCAADFLYRERSRVVGAGLLGLLLAGTLTTKGFLGRAAGNHALAYGSVTACAAIALGTVAYILWRRGSPGLTGDRRPSPTPQG